MLENALNLKVVEEPHHSRKVLEELERKHKTKTGKVILNYKRGNYFLDKKLMRSWVHHYNIYKKSKVYKGGLT